MHRKCIDMPFVFSRCSYVVWKKDALGRKTAGTDKYLLRDVSASVSAKEVLAIMGPSGAGKTTLLKMLSLQSMGGMPYGDVALDGVPFTPTVYTKRAASVEQSDTLWPFFTCYDHLWYAIDACQPNLSGAQQNTMINKLLSDLGLESCRNTRAGNALIKGLSGGQKRRLSLGLALTKQPTLIILDEPTSGLDAAGAAAIMRMMHTVAVNLNAAVLCTIHQPSAKVFEGFDKTLILSGGRLAYVGAASEMAGYLGSIGLPVPPATNPADFMLDVVNKDFVSEEDVEKVLSRWTPTPAPASDASSASPTGVTRGFLGQLTSLMYKHGVLSLKDPILYIARVFIALNLALFLQIIFIKSREA